MFGPPPPSFFNKKQQESIYPKPTKFSEVFPYLGKVIGGFFYRLFYIIGLVWQANPFLMIAMVLLCLATGVLPVFGALISKELINSINAVLNDHGIIIEEQMFASLKGTLATVGFFLMIQFFYMLTQRILNRLHNMVNFVAGEIVSNHIKVKIMNKAKSVDLASFDNPQFYERLENANREAGMRPISILTNTFSIISSAVSAVSFFVILATLGWVLPVIMLVISIPTAIVNYVFRNQNFRYIRRNSKPRRQMNYYSDVVTNKDLVKEMRLMNLSDSFISRYQSTFKEYFKGLKNITIRETIWQLIVASGTLIADTVLFFYIAYNVINNHLQIGDFTLLTGALTSIVSSVSSIISNTASIYEGTLFIHNLMLFMKEEPSIVPSIKEPLKPSRHTDHVLKFEDVGFRYPGTERMVLSHFNCEMRSGEKVVLVGLNGAGKTTLIKLMTRLYDPTEGRILLDGHDLKEYDPKSLYKLFGTIFQDFGKYALTVKENIALGNIEKEIKEDEIQKAAQMGDVDSYISKLPKGMDTPLMKFFEEEATDLSIGQWQKVCIARAFYADSDILILDEPTASLDAIAEQEIYDHFAKLAENKLTLLVSHRLSSAVTASKIIVIDGGTLAEMGTHEELMKKKGIYFRLFSTQAKNYQTKEEMELCRDDFPPPPPKDFPKGFSGDFPPMHQ